jgi:hypothetical protein
MGTSKRKVSLELIEDEALRKSCYTKRRERLLKKLNEITILCGIDAYSTIYGSCDKEPLAWPSPMVTTEPINRFQQTLVRLRKQ